MDKILIIGQAPPAVKQSVPYDTTMLYEMLSWIGISKEQAQEMFEFEAMTDKFPGYNSDGGHKEPSKENMKKHYHEVLVHKISKCNFQVIILGNVAKRALEVHGGQLFEDTVNYIHLMHPSKRNQGRILIQKENITQKLKKFIYG